MTFQARVFTFYSYKGGVGRSMALLNTAYYLQARGRHVLIVDLDLDAPGSSGFLRRTGELSPRQNGGGDVVDLLAVVIQSVKVTPPGKEPTVPELRLTDFLCSVDRKKFATPVHPTAPPARLDVLAADESHDYPSRLSALELSSMSAGQVAGVSDVLRGVLLRHRFPFHQPWQEEGEPPEETPYDYILVDSRTGLSEVGGLCVGPLSDRLVVLCGLNDQNIDGTKRFLDIVGLERKSRSDDAEAWDDADISDITAPRPPTLGPKPTLLVASPVPGGEMEYKKKRIKVLEREIGLAPVKLSYHPQMALMETLFVRDHEDEYLSLEYATLVNRAMGMVGDTDDQLLVPLRKLLRTRSAEEQSESDASDLPRRFARIALASGQADVSLYSARLRRLGVSQQVQDQIRRVSIRLAPTKEQQAKAWLSWADELDTEEARATGDANAFQSMEDKYRKALSLKPDFHPALHNWGIALTEWGKYRQGSEADKLFAQAGEKYEQALAVKPDKHEALYNWGNALFEQARKKLGSEADALFSQAGKKYEQALAIKPDKHEALYNWGNALFEQGQNKKAMEAVTFFAEAGERYRKALAIKPDKHEALNNWGNALLAQARRKEGPEAGTLFAAAEEKFQQALAIKPDKYEALYNWGNTLLAQARRKEGADADELYAEAKEKYQQVLAIKPNNYDALNTWGNALSDQARRKEGWEADALYAEAAEKYKQALAIKPDNHEALNNWGGVLLEQAQRKEGSDADALYAEAKEKYKQALAIKPDKHEAFNNWGNVLFAEAQRKGGSEADALFGEAQEKYEQALVIEPDDHEALNDWGRALSSQAWKKEGAQADALFAQAVDKYKQALAIKPNKHEALNRWGVALSAWAQKKEGSAADALFSQARDKFQQALDIKHTASVLFNIACLAGLRGDAEGAADALEHWMMTKKRPTKVEIDKDPDFDRVRSDPRFQAVCEKLLG